MAQPTTGQLLTDIEREIQTGFRTKPPVNDSRNSDPPTVHSPATMPEYVEHRDGVTEIGKLSAEAVVREYEAAAKEIEAMGADLVEQGKQCERVMAEALGVTDELKELAARYRTEAKRVFDQIENYSLVVAEVRKTCTELRDKIAVPTAQERHKKK
jgi:hypothetical protein